MAMSKKHFIAFARMLRKAHANATTAGETAIVGGMESAIIEICRSENHNFDVARFRAAIETGKGI